MSLRALLIVLPAAIRAGLVVLHPPDTALASRELPVTALKYMGTERFDLNITGPLIKLGGEVCDRCSPTLQSSNPTSTTLPRSRHRICAPPPATSALRSRDLAGAMIVFELSSTRCSFETMYLNLLERDVALALSSWVATPPGEFFFSHDGSRGRRTRGATMPMLELAAGDAEALIRCSTNRTLTVRVTPSRNRWLELFALHSWYSLVMRCFLPALAFTTGGLALRTLRARLTCAKLWTGDFTLPSLVLITEMIATPLIGLVLAAGYTTSTDVLPDPVATFFLSGFAGLKLFTALILAPISRQHWRDERDARAHQMQKFGLAEHKMKIGVLFSLTVAPDLVFGAMVASHSLSRDAVVQLGASYSLLGVLLGIYFIVLVVQSNADVVRAVSHSIHPNTTTTIVSPHVAHMIAWLGVSGICLIVAAAGFFVLTRIAREGRMSPSAAGACRCVAMLGRFGASYAQVRSLDVIPTPTAGVLLPTSVEMLCAEQQADERPRTHVGAEDPGVTFFVYVGAHVDGITRMTMPESTTVGALGRAVETLYAPPGGGSVSCLFVGRCYELDEDDIAANVIEFGEKVTVGWEDRSGSAVVVTRRDGGAAILA